MRCGFFLFCFVFVVFFPFLPLPARRAAPLLLVLPACLHACRISLGWLAGNRGCPGPSATLPPPRLHSNRRRRRASPSALEALAVARAAAFLPCPAGRWGGPATGKTAPSRGFSAGHRAHRSSLESVELIPGKRTEERTGGVGWRLPLLWDRLGLVCPTSGRPTGASEPRRL